MSFERFMEKTITRYLESDDNGLERTLKKKGYRVDKCYNATNSLFTHCEKYVIHKRKASKFDITIGKKCEGCHTKLCEGCIKGGLLEGHCISCVTSQTKFLLDTCSVKCDNCDLTKSVQMIKFQDQTIVVCMKCLIVL